MVNAEEFIKTYLESGRSLQATAEKLNTVPLSVQARFTAYRKRGIKLPLPKDRNRNKLDVKSLNELIKSYK